MPKGPQGQRRPADAIGAAVTIAKTVTGEAVLKAANAGWE